MTGECSNIQWSRNDCSISDKAENSNKYIARTRIITSISGVPISFDFGRYSFLSKCTGKISNQDLEVVGSGDDRYRHIDLHHNTLTILLM
jgi:hypothetical protein